MMHVYDSIISIRSKTNLVALSTIAIFLYALFFCFDLIRARLLIESSNSIERFFQPYIITVTKKYDVDDAHFLSIASSIDKLKQFIKSPVLPAFLDTLFSPIFIILSCCIHPILGSWALISGILILTITFLFQTKNEKLEHQSITSRQDEIHFGNAILHNPGYMYTSSTRDFILKYWNKKRSISQDNLFLLAKNQCFGTSIIKTLRMILQSSILGIGAWLVIDKNLSAGSIIATSIIATRAIAPLEQIINAKKYLKIGIESFKHLISLNDLTTTIINESSPKDSISMQLPNNTITANNITLRDKKTSQIICKNLSFIIPEGKNCVIYGPPGCGKSDLLLSMIGLITLGNGIISFGDKKTSRKFIENYFTQIGYLSQNCTLFPISIIENITLSHYHEENSLSIAQKATKIIGCHEDILSLEKGYLTTCSANQISYNLTQKICLSRIIANDPAILLMDEPLHYLDKVAKNIFYTLLEKFKENKKTIVMVSHDPTVISMSDFLLVFHPTQGFVFGPTNKIANSQSCPTVR
ncbi:ATP-binding cassette domain-containing protein [Candidatus Liberibacter africanus]|uniref:ATP-binding cassette domain-containing protein n=1 Tax=Liberibacter africanus TaxID=34020 RepID=UPI00339D3B62